MSKPSEKAMQRARDLMFKLVGDINISRQLIALDMDAFASETLAEQATFYQKQLDTLTETVREHKRVIEMAEKALRNFVYETTHLSPQREDGAHDCRISALTLRYGREGLAEIAKLRKE